MVDKYGKEYAKEMVREVIDINESAEGGVRLGDFDNV